MATAPPSPIPPRPSTPPTGREVTITAQQVQPPSPLYLQPEDSLHLIIDYPTSNFAGQSFLLALRFLRPDGEITPTLISLPGTGPITGYVYDTKLGEGFLLSATLSAPYTASIGGGIYTTLQVLRNQPAANNVVWQLFSDYVDQRHSASWPYGRSITPQEGAGKLRSITGTAPGAGSEINEQVPASTRWNLLSFTFTLTTSAAAANRNPRIFTDDGANITFLSPSTVAQPASSTFRYSTTPGLNFFNDALNNIILSLPSILLLGPGHRIRTSTPSLQAGDVYSAPQYLVLEWVEF